MGHSATKTLITELATKMRQAADHPAIAGALARAAAAASAVPRRWRQAGAAWRRLIGLSAAAAVKPPARPDNRLPGLDGLRAVAVVAVILYHADLSWSLGGYLGVDLFFVISGFLITGLLVQEVEKKGRLDLVQFYLRRARRLLPASLLMTVSVVLLAALLAPDALHRLRADAAASLVYVVNWELIFAGKSYFEQIGRQPLLLHLWSLAIEEQFYILWAPVIFFVVPRYRARWLGRIAAVAMIASIAWMGVLHWQLSLNGPCDPSRLYFGTDTHGFCLLAGALLAVVWRRHQLKPAAPGPGVEGNFLVGLVALVATALTFVYLREDVPWLYPWGFLVSVAASSGLIAAATYPGGYFGRWLDQQPLRWIGERSYGIYLWHWPVFMLTRPGLDIPWTDRSILVLRIALTFVIAGLSYKYVEVPIRQGWIDEQIRKLRLPKPERARQSWRFPAIAGGTTAAAFLAAVVVLIRAPQEPAAPRDLVIGPSQHGQVQAAAEEGRPLHPATVFNGADLTVIGDSVLLGTAPMIAATLPGVKIYATVGWQAQNVLDQIKALRQSHALTSVVLIHLGTNGYVTEPQLRQMLELLADRKLVLVMNIHVPRRWMDANNDLIDRVLPDFPNTALVDWKSLSDGEADFFVSDGVHPTLAGQRVIVGEIVRVGKFAVAPPPDWKLVITRKTDVAALTLTAPEDRSPSLVRLAHPIAPDSYWQAMARCESEADWQQAGQFAGGLGIFIGSWRDWGGLEFAPSPDLATPEQQIAVANRISTQGWRRPDGTWQRPAGFRGWGCAKMLGEPELLLFTADSIIAQHFQPQARALAIRELQLILGLPPDGQYGRRTRLAHQALQARRNQAHSLVSVEAENRRERQP